MKYSLNRLNRLFHDQTDANRARHMVNTVCFTDQLLHQLLVENCVDDEPEAFLVFEVLDVRITSCRQVVYDCDLVPAFYKFVRQMAADKSSTAGNENLHIRMIVKSSCRRTRFCHNVLEIGSRFLQSDC